jgi:hypothetical protein
VLADDTQTALQVFAASSDDDFDVDADPDADDGEQRALARLDQVADDARKFCLTFNRFKGSATPALP